MQGRPRKPPARGRPPKPADPDSTVTPDVTEVRDVVAPRPTAPDAAGQARPSEGVELIAAILRYLRRWPNQTVDLAPLAAELGVDPAEMQLTAARLEREGMVIVPFIVPSRAGGGTLTEVGLRWLIEHEGGRPADVPVAFQPAAQRVRAEDEAARLPRARVYGVRRD